MSDINTNSNLTESKVAVSNTKSTSSTLILQCSIRRKPGQVGLPGSNPSERVYKIGSSLDVRTRKPLKGISGKTELKLMPEIVGVSVTDPQFKKEVSEYWSNISVVVPPDEDHLKEYEKGKVLTIKFDVKSNNLKEQLKSTNLIAEKINIIIKGIESDKIEIHDESLSDFLLLTYCIRYSRVAVVPEDIGKSPKIHFFIYNKTTAIKNKLSSIQTRTRAINLFQKVQDDEKLLDAILIMFNDLPENYSGVMEKIIQVDAEYNKSINNMNKFIEYVENKDWETIFLLNLAVKKGKLTNPTNTESYYYNQVLIGKTLKEAVLFIDSEQEEAINIKKTLIKEVGL